MPCGAHRGPCVSGQEGSSLRWHLLTLSAAAAAVDGVQEVWIQTLRASNSGYSAAGVVLQAFS